MILIESGGRPCRAARAFEIGVELARLVDVLLDREHDLGRLRGEIAAGLGLAGVHDHRPALRRTLDHQRAAHLEVLALVIEHVQLGRVEEQAFRLVQHEGVVLPGVPEAEHHLHELGGALVAIGVRRMLGMAEVERLGGGRRGHQVPAGAAFAELIERGEHPCHMERLEIGGGRGRDQADVLRHRSQRAEQRDRLDAMRHRGALPHIDVVGAEGRLGISVEDEVELRSLGELRQVHVVAELHAGPRVRRGIAPGRDVVPGSVQEEAKLHHGNALCGPVAKSTTN